MIIKSRRFRKRNNKSRGTRKNKTTQRYKKQMKLGGNREEYIKKQKKIDKRIDEIFSGRHILVAKYNGDKLIIKKISGSLLAFNYEPYVESGKTVVKYDFTKQTFLEYIDKQKIIILDENI